MKPLDHYDITPASKASFKISLDTQTWEFMHKAVPTMDIAFELFPDLEAIDIDFIKPEPDGHVAYLSRVPRAWMRINGELDLHVPDDDAYGVSGYLLEIGEQISPLPLSLFSPTQSRLLAQQRFNLTFTPSACLVRDPVLLEAAQNDWNGTSKEDLLLVEGFTSHANPGGSKRHRLSAQMTTVCELLGRELDLEVELDRIFGSHSKN
jgi:hypothetical protein